MANRLGISERSLFRLVEKLKEMNAPIYFDRNQNTYSYREPFELEISISIRVLSKGETHTLYGGQVKKNHSLPGFGREARYFYPTKPEIARKTVWKIFSFSIV